MLNRAEYKLTVKCYELYFSRIVLVVVNFALR